MSLTQNRITAVPPLKFSQQKWRLFSKSHLFPQRDRHSTGLCLRWWKEERQKCWLRWLFPRAVKAASHAPAMAQTWDVEWSNSTGQALPGAVSHMLRGQHRLTRLLSTGRVSGHYKSEKLFIWSRAGFSWASPLQLLTSSSFLPGDGMECAREQWAQRNMEPAVKSPSLLSFQVHQEHRRLREDCENRV